MSEPIRINKYLSDLGVVSRREADRLIAAGQILINGRPALVGEKVTGTEEILVEGRPVTKKAPEKVVLAVNKPVGVVCTTRDFPGEENIVRMVGYPTRLYPVGRLDKDSEGLIFLTNDGALAAELTRAAGHHEKAYEVTVQKEMTDNFLKRMEKGIYLSELDKTTAACKVTRLSDRSFMIVLTQGLNRQIRRMCETLGYEVRSLKRVRIMNITLDGIEPGKYRVLRGEELTKLQKSVKKKGKTWTKPGE